MIDIAFQHRHLAGAAQAFAAVALDIDIGAAQRIEKGLIIAHLQRDAGFAQLDFKAVLLVRVEGCLLYTSDAADD